MRQQTYRQIDSEQAWAVAERIRSTYQQFGCICLPIHEANTGSLYFMVDDRDESSAMFKVRVSDHAPLSGFKGISLDIADAEIIEEHIELIEWEYAE